MKKLIRHLGPLLMLVTAAGLVRADLTEIFTLYRSSAVTGGETWRVHVATFDAVGDADYNMENCDLARRLFQAQSGVTVKYWCERGRFKPK